MSDAKVKTIQEWPEPKKVKDILSEKKKKKNFILE